MTRAELLYEYDRLCRLLVVAGSEPVVSDAVLEVFNDLELAALVKDAALRLVQIRRVEG
jgi:hypothetical protein